MPPGIPGLSKDEPLFIELGFGLEVLCSNIHPKLKKLLNSTKISGPSAVLALHMYLPNA